MNSHGLPDRETTQHRVLIGGVILCGGASRRMGVPKHELQFGKETMLARVVRIVAQVFSPIVLVAAPSQILPDDFEACQIVHDRVAGRGPLEGIVVGLSALPPTVQAAMITSCDLPLIDEVLLQSLESAYLKCDRAVRGMVPRDSVSRHPLPGLYDRGLVPMLESMLNEGEYRVGAIADRVTIAELRLSQMETPLDESVLRNVNRWDDYIDALRLAGLEPPESGTC